MPVGLIRDDRCPVGHGRRRAGRPRRHTCGDDFVVEDGRDAVGVGDAHRTAAIDRAVERLSARIVDGSADVGEFADGEHVEGRERLLLDQRVDFALRAAGGTGRVDDVVGQHRCPLLRVDVGRVRDGLAVIVGIGIALRSGRRARSSASVVELELVDHLVDAGICGTLRLVAVAVQAGEPQLRDHVGHQRADQDQEHRRHEQDGDERNTAARPAIGLASGRTHGLPSPSSLC